MPDYKDFAELLGQTLTAVTIRFLGESNGYYSESVDFIKVQA